MTAAAAAAPTEASLCGGLACRPSVCPPGEPCAAELIIPAPQTNKQERRGPRSQKEQSWVHCSSDPEAWDCHSSQMQKLSLREVPRSTWLGETQTQGCLSPWSGSFLAWKQCLPLHSSACSQISLHRTSPRRKEGTTDRQSRKMPFRGFRMLLAVEPPSAL